MKVKNTDILKKIITAIKAENDARIDGSTMASDHTNECLIGIFSEFGIIDDEDEIINMFGVDGLQAIREAEAGLY